MQSVYLMPGMGANPRIFEFISLPDHFNVNFLSWIPPQKKESLEHYAMRMCERVEHEKPILIGVSFGGVLVQEMAKHINCNKVVIISSVKSNQELPKHIKLAHVTNAHKLLPTQWVKNIETFALTRVRTIPPSLLLRGVRTATTALCKGPLIPPIIMSKKPGII